MRRGEIWQADLEPVRGSEADKRRPVIVVSIDSANVVVQRFRRGTITVVPLTTNVASVYQFNVMLPAAITGLPRDCKAQTEQIRALAIERFIERLGVVPWNLMEQVEDALRLHLDL